MAKIILKKVKIEEQVENGENLFVRFEKSLNSETGSDILAQGVLLQKKLGYEIDLITSATYGEILGVVGEKVAVDEVMKLLKTK